MMRPAALLLALLFALPCAAQIYTWKDKQGQTHYSDTPPPTGEVKTLRGAPPQHHVPIADDSEGAANAGEDEDQQPAATAAEQRATEAQANAEAERARAQEAERERFCAQAGNQLKALKSGQRIARMNAAGEREFLSDAERAEEIDRLERQIAENCN